MSPNSVTITRPMFGGPAQLHVGYAVKPGYTDPDLEPVPARNVWRVQFVIGSGEPIELPRVLSA